jgi:hypothetical protein
VKVLTHRSRFIEPATVPKFGGETSSATEAKEPTLTQKTEEPAAMPKVSLAKLGEPKADSIRSYKPFGRSDSAEGTKRSYSYPQEEKDGQCIRCVGDNKDFKLYSRENCRSFKNTN